MNLYVFARVMQGLAKMAIKKGVVKDSRGTVSKYSWPVFGSLTWAAVMYLFRWHPDIIQVCAVAIFCSPVAEYEKFNEVFICEFRPLGFLEEFLVAQYIDVNRTGIEEPGFGPRDRRGSDNGEITAVFTDKQVCL
jgi:hypothetical protein